MSRLAQIDRVMAELEQCRLEHSFGAALGQDPTAEAGGLQYQVSFPENALSGTDCNRLLDGSPILLRTENYATTKRNEIQACSDVVGTCAFLPTAEAGGFSRFSGELDWLEELYRLLWLQDEKHNSNGGRRHIDRRRTSA